MKTYSWKFRTIQADPQLVGEELEQLGEVVTPSAIVKTARDPAKELHRCFDWNDKEAAEKYRYTQAEFLLRNLAVHITIEKKEPINLTVRAFEHVDMPISDENDAMKISVYMNTEQALRDDKARAQIFERIRTSIRQARQTAKNYAQLFPVLCDVENRLIETENVLNE